MKIQKWLFPYDNIRPEQEKVLNIISENYDKYNNFIIEAPTGTGKSAIAYTLMQNVDNAVVITANKYLQDQYEQDFKDLLSIKGQNAYNCIIKDVTCDKGPCIVNHNTSECKQQCEYHTKMKQIINDNNSSLIVTSYAAFLSNNILNSKPYDLIILDEAHLVESSILQNISITLDIDKLDEEFEILSNATLQDMVVIGTTHKSGYESNKAFINTLYSLIQQKLKELQDLKFHSVDEEKYMYAEQAEKLSRKEKSLSRFMIDKNKANWVIEPNKDNVLCMQPVDIGDLFYRKFIKNHKHTPKLVFLSATILNAKTYMQDLQLTSSNTKCIRVKSNFNPKLAPIIYKPCGKMNYQEINNTLPNIVNAVRQILDMHKGEKGIIHTNNYKITNEIIKQCNNKRLLHKNYKGLFYSMTNEELLKEHEHNPLDTVLISPSLTTGADLKDDLSRFQIIIKLPFASLSDKRVKKKSSINPQWYTDEMLRSLIQMSGRSVRHIKDYCITYVLDSSFEYYIRKNDKILSSQFKERITMNENNFDRHEYDNLIKQL